MSNEHTAKQVMVVTPTKSVGVAIILTLLFGQLEMFYSTVRGAILMRIVSLIAGVLTFGFGLILPGPACVIWGAVAANNHNKALLAGQNA